ncbi:hypothetical protein GCK72_009047 [Caenorhabditis remanei]|uniref:RING-type domain-containing protein n=1 Tax=Caenorhabditis remanei TaxID=31234 RepID=A0A6A5H0J9_CAERE|nr:hypothetical protein GCK72_009047 [Caenorhabditis remanei]KAF1760797.1 hypothetical protein GCK72_009047 [Caenorhabditis remanei]
MPRKRTPKNDDVPPSLDEKNAQIQKMKADLKKLDAEILAEKKKGREAKQKHKQDMERLRWQERGINNEIFYQTSRHAIQIGVLKKDYDKTKIELAQLRVDLKLATDEQVKAEIVKEDQDTRERLERRTKHLEEVLNSGSNRKVWKECELCSLEFEEHGLWIPKVLKCGHTFCWGCVQRLAKPDFIRCPIDKTVFVFSENDDVNKIPKNFRALNAL